MAVGYNREKWESDGYPGLYVCADNWRIDCDSAGTECLAAGLSADTSDAQNAIAPAGYITVDMKKLVGTEIWQSMEDEWLSSYKDSGQEMPWVSLVCIREDMVCEELGGTYSGTSAQMLRNMVVWLLDSTFEDYGVVIEPFEGSEALLDALGDSPNEMYSQVMADMGIDDYDLLSHLGEYEEGDCAVWNDYVIFTTSTEHNLSVGDDVGFISAIEGAEGEYIVGAVIDEYTFGILASALPDGFYSDGWEVDIIDGRQFCAYSGMGQDPLEVYENNVLLTIGSDYVISLDDGATWLGEWPIDSGYDEFHRRAKAGRFYIRFINYDTSAIYWTRYFIYRNQELTQDGLVRLKNGRVIFDESLKHTSGSLQTVLVSRTNTANPYITPVTTEYSLRVQEKPGDVEPSGVSRRREVTSRESRDTLNVS